MAHPSQLDYDPNRPWAQTDALITILAQNLNKTYHQYLQITGVEPSPTRTDALFAPLVQGSGQNSNFRPLAPRPMPAQAPPPSYTSQSPALLSQGLQSHTSQSPHAARQRNKPKASGAPVASPFFEDTGDMFSNAAKNSAAAVTSGPESGAGPVNYNPSMAATVDMDGYHQAEFLEDAMHGSPYDSSIPIDPNLTSRADDGDGLVRNHDGLQEATINSDVIDPTLMMLNRQGQAQAQTQGQGQGQAGPSYYAASPENGGYYRNDQNLGARFNQGMPKRLKASPFFADASNAKRSQPSPKRAPGTISCIPFPTLEEERFGIIQEELADEPFLLLIAVTFLIKTKGTAAIPTFRQVIQRFPTLEDLADPANTALLTQMIHHLGLSDRRARMIQRYARDWLERPPSPYARYTVRNYTSRALELDIGSPLQPGSNNIHDEGEGPADTPAPCGGGDLNAWEIGHLTQGRYAIDSWRIFCRDRLLGKALDWKGAGAHTNFQPEWMRVIPSDKELRAYLRWMWMKEGWEWDPMTGGKQPLREEMWKAVNERRVVWNDDGDLVIDSDRYHSSG